VRESLISLDPDRSPATHNSSTTPGQRASLSCPESKFVRARLRAMAADLVASWRSGGMPPSSKTQAGLRTQAESLGSRASARPEHVGWTMVTIVSEYWRERLRSGTPGRRLLLLPDCPYGAIEKSRREGNAQSRGSGDVPQVCGPSCAIATIWSAARQSGWVVESTSQAVRAIGSLLTGQYDGVLGVAKLRDLEKAFAMLPAFSLPIAAVPFEPIRFAGVPFGNRSCSCADAMPTASIDVEWVLGLLGVAGGSAPVDDYLPLLHEAAAMFTPAALVALEHRLGLPSVLGTGTASQRDFLPLEATAGMAGEFVTRGGKFLRPFIALAAFDAVCADAQPQESNQKKVDGRRLGESLDSASGISRAAIDPVAIRDSVKAAAVAIEIFHKASLVHDDIEDDDQMRYGLPTLHVQRGIPSAINVGDYMLGLGYRIVSALPGIDAITQRDLVAILSAAHLRLAQGQGAELWWRDAGKKRLSPQEAIAIYGLKTSPAFEAAIAMGIRLAGLAVGEAGAIDRYALHVGTGFQMLNDLKDWSGDLENNRRAAGDLLGGRPTLMWALALERLPAEDADCLTNLAAVADQGMASEQAIAEAVAQARRLYEKADVFARAAQLIDQERSHAAAAAATCPFRRLRDVLDFLLDLAVPEQAALSRDVGQ